MPLGSGKTAAMKGILNCMEAARLPMSGIYIISLMILSNLQLLYNYYCCKSSFFWKKLEVVDNLIRIANK